MHCVRLSVSGICVYWNTLVHISARSRPRPKHIESYSSPPDFGFNGRKNPSLATGHLPSYRPFTVLPSIYRPSLPLYRSEERSSCRTAALSAARSSQNSVQIIHKKAPKEKTNHRFSALIWLTCVIWVAAMAQTGAEQRMLKRIFYKYYRKIEISFDVPYRLRKINQNTHCK